jgi:hypothetical protein
MGACQCITNTSDNIDIKMTLPNTRIHKLKLAVESDEKGNDILILALTRHEDEDTNKNSLFILKSDRKSKKSNSSYIFDYKEHAMVIFDVFNLFRNKPQKFFKKMIKNGYWGNNIDEYTKQTKNNSTSIKWCDEIYNILYIRDGVDNLEEVNQLLATELSYNSAETVIFKLEGDYDPEMSILMLLKQYSHSLDILLSDKYTLGTINCYNDPDRIFFYLIRK